MVGVLLAAKARGHISGTKPLLDALRRQAGFYLSEPFYREALRLARE